MDWFNRLSDKSQVIVRQAQERRRKAVASYLSHGMTKNKARKIVFECTSQIENICINEIRQENLL